MEPIDMTAKANSWKQQQGQKAAKAEAELQHAAAHAVTPSGDMGQAEALHKKQKAAEAAHRAAVDAAKRDIGEAPERVISEAALRSRRAAAHKSTGFGDAVAKLQAEREISEEQKANV